MGTLTYTESEQAKKAGAHICGYALCNNEGIPRSIKQNVHGWT